MAKRVLVCTKTERVYSVDLDIWVTVKVYFWDTGTVTCDMYNED